MQLSTMLAWSLVVLLMSAQGCLPLRQGLQGLGGDGPPEISIPLTSPFYIMWLIESVLKWAKRWCQTSTEALEMEGVMAVNACSGSLSPSKGNAGSWAMCADWGRDWGMVSAGIMKRFPQDLTLQLAEEVPLSVAECAYIVQESDCHAIFGKLAPRE